jgi:DNA-binding transcriptional LysR family regulator
MPNFTLQELACFEAVVAEGSFQAAATRLHRTHPAVYAAVRSLEAHVGATLLDRSAYRVQLTVAGKSFLERAKSLLDDARALDVFSEHLAKGEETELSIVVGDLCPTEKVVKLLRRFFDECPNTRLHLHFEAIGGPWERLFSEQADLILHYVDKHDARLQWANLFEVTVVPVVAPKFLPFPITNTITPRQMKDRAQCIIRDSARKEGRDYFIVKGARSWTVADQLMKKELICMGMGWGHLPLHLIGRELRNEKLLSIEGKHFKRSSIDVVAARLRSRPAGPVAERLWNFLVEQKMHA